MYTDYWFRTMQQDYIGEVISQGAPTHKGMKTYANRLLKGQPVGKYTVEICCASKKELEEDSLACCEGYLVLYHDKNDNNFIIDKNSLEKYDDIFLIEKDIKKCMNYPDYTKTINEIIQMEKESGHILYDWDDYQHDLHTMAGDLEIELIENEEEELVFQSEEDEEYVKEALEYYYSSH